MGEALLAFVGMHPVILVTTLRDAAVENVEDLCEQTTEQPRDPRCDIKDRVLSDSGFGAVLFDLEPGGEVTDPEEQRAELE